MLFAFVSVQVGRLDETNLVHEMKPTLLPSARENPEINNNVSRKAFRTNWKVLTILVNRCTYARSIYDNKTTLDVGKDACLQAV